LTTALFASIHNFRYLIDFLIFLTRADFNNQQKVRRYKMIKIFSAVLLFAAITGCSNQPAVREIISSPNAPTAIGPYSQAVRVGDNLYLSGQLGLDPATGKFAGQDFEVQARQALENQKAILDTAGFSLKDVVQCQVFLTDMNNYPKFNDIYKEYFKGDFPARAVLEVSRIPADGLIEIMMVAKRCN
jgi:2-iminobutanoate/2-iminopropanoate deaminase